MSTERKIGGLSYRWLAVIPLVFYLSGITADDRGNFTGPILFMADQGYFHSRVIYFSGSGRDIYNQLRDDEEYAYRELKSDILSFSEKTALAFDYDDSLIFWSDPGLHSIDAYNLTNDSHSTVFIGTSTYVMGVAVDWVANNIYWTDAAYNWIKIANYNGSFVRTLVTTGLDVPAGIACDPQNGYLYWSDWGDDVKIERSNLDGSDRIVLVNGSVVGNSVIGSPAALSIDYEQQMLYWTDNLHNRIISLDLNNENQIPTTVFHAEEEFIELFSLDIDPDFGFFASDIRRKNLLLIPFDGDPIFDSHVYEPNGIIFYNASRQPVQSNTCDDKDCSQICVSHPGSGMCLCDHGYRLLEDGKTCQIDDSILHEHELIFSAEGNYLCKMPANIAHQDLPETFNVTCFSELTTNAIDFDVFANFIYGHVNLHAINGIWRVRLSDKEQWQNIVDGTDATGIAVDWISSNIYWADRQERSIKLCRLDGAYVTRLINQHVDRVYGIVVHPVKRYLFWSDLGAGSGDAPARIERSGLNGRQRRMLVSHNIQKPSNLAIDFNKNRLYWTDDYTYAIESVDFDGGDRKTFMRYSPYVRFVGITIFQDFMFVGESLQKQIQIWNIPEKARVRTITLGKEPTAVKFYHKSLQPVTGEPNPCDIYNGGCDQICINTEHGAECLCSIPSYTVCDTVYRCPMTIPHGRMQDTCDNRNDKRCHFTCDAGYWPTTTNAITCTDMGEWDTDRQELCTNVLSCPVTIPNGKIVDACDNRSGQRCGYTCNAGFTPVTQYVICSQDGVWNTDSTDRQELCMPIKPTDKPEKRTDDKDKYPNDKTTIVVLAVIIAIIVLIGIVALLAFLLWRRKKHNIERRRPDTQYIVGDVTTPEQSPDGGIIGIPNPMYTNATNLDYVDNACAPPQYSAVDPSAATLNAAANGGGALQLPEKVALPDGVELQADSNTVRYMNSPGASTPFDHHMYEAVTDIQNQQVVEQPKTVTLTNEADA